MPDCLESDLKDLWERAGKVLIDGQVNHDEVVDVMCDVRTCLERVKIRDIDGQEELDWLTDVLANILSGEG